MMDFTPYEERAHLVALLAELYPSYWDFSDPATPNWPVVYVELPTGQVSWHIDPNDWILFPGVPRRVGAQWDGHTTEEKYVRVMLLTQKIEFGELPMVDGTLKTGWHDQKPWDWR